MKTETPVSKPPFTTILRKNGSKRVQTNYHEESMTDQAPASELTMESIQRKIQKGIPLNLPEGQKLYGQQPSVSNLQEVFALQQSVTDLYNALPLEIREKMGHDVKNFETVIFDPENTELLLEHGLAVSTTDSNKELIKAIKTISNEQNAPKNPLPESNPNNPTDPRSKNAPA